MYETDFSSRKMYESDVSFSPDPESPLNDLNAR